MKKSLKLTLGLAALGLMVAPLASCGGESNTDDGSIKVVFGHTFGDKVETALNRYIKKFVDLVKKNEGVDVEVELMYLGGYSDVSTKITTYFSDGTLPTMTIAYPDAVADFLYNNDIGPKYVVNFDDYINNEEYGLGKDKYLGDKTGISDFVQSYIEEGQKFTEPGTYSFPFMKSSEIMLYNLDAATEAMKYYDAAAVAQGKVEEKIASFTWDDLMEFAEVIKEHKDSVSSVLRYPVFYDSDSNLFITQMYQEGYQYSSIKNGKGNIDFDDNGANLEGAKKLLGEYKKWHDDGLFTTKGTEGTYASNAFKNAECIFTIGSSGGAGYTFPEAGQFETKICKVPARNNNPYYISQGPSVSFLRNPFHSDERNNRNLKYAWKFLKYITSTEVNAALCITGSEGYAPVRTSCYSTETYLEFMEKGDNYANAAKVLTDDINGKYISSAIFHGSATLRNEVGSAVTGLLTGKITNINDAIASAINNTKKDMGA